MISTKEKYSPFRKIHQEVSNMNNSYFSVKNTTYTIIDDLQLNKTAHTRVSKKSFSRLKHSNWPTIVLMGLERYFFMPLIIGLLTVFLYCDN